MSPPARKAIRPSTSSPSRNKRRRPRKKPGQPGFFHWRTERGKVAFARRERLFLDRTGALLYPFGSMDKRKAWREQGRQLGERGNAAASPFRRAPAALSSPPSGNGDAAPHQEEALKAQGGRAALERVRE